MVRFRPSSANHVSGRDDWLWLSTSGTVTTYINQRGEGKGMVPRWLTAGEAHSGMDHEIGDDRAGVQFGRLFGGPAARQDVSRRSRCLHPFDPLC